MARGGSVASAEIRAVVCDADVHVQNTLHQFLPLNGIQIVAMMGTFAEALRLVDERVGDVLVLHGSMPGAMDGVEEMRARGDLMPVVVISANEELREAALARGADGFYYMGRGAANELVECIRTAVATRGGGGRGT